MTITTEQQLIQELRNLRIKLGISQWKLSKAVWLWEYQMNYYEKWKKNNRQTHIKLETVLKIVEFFRENGVDIDLQLNIKQS